MPRNGSGTFNRIHDWTDDAAAAIKISSTRMDAEMDGMATALTDSIAKDGQTTPTADLPMGNFKHTGVANASARTHYAAAGQVQDGSLLSATAGGTADAITLTLAPAITAYATNQKFHFIAGGTNTGAVTVNVSGVGAKAVKKRGGTALDAGDIVTGQGCIIIYDGTDFELLNPTGYVTTETTQTVSGAKTFSSQATFSAGIAVGAQATFSAGIAVDGASPIVFEGATADAFETTLAVTDPTADQTITLPNATGIVPLRTDAVTTTTEVVSTASETTVYTKSITGGTLGTAGALSLTMIGDYLNNSGASRDLLVKVKYGATTIVSVAHNTVIVNAARRTVLINCDLHARGATNSQVAAGTVLMDGLTASTTATDNSGEFHHRGAASGHNAVAEDSTAAKDLVVTVTHSASHASLSFKMLSARLVLTS